MEGLRKGIGLLLSRRDRAHFRSLYAVLVVGAILEVLSLASITLFISLLVPSDSAPGGAREIYLRALESAFGESPAAVVWGAVGVALALNLVRTLWNVMGMWIQYRIQANRRIELSGRLMRAYLLAPSDFHGKKSPSELLSHVVMECDNVVQGTYSPIFELVRGASMVICVVLMLLFWTPMMTLAALLLMGLSCAAVLSFRNRRLRRLADEEQKGREKAVSVGMETLGARVDATICGKRASLSGRFKKVLRALSLAQGGNMLQVRSTWPLLEFLSLGSLLLVACAALVFSRGDVAAIAPQIALLAMALMRLKSTAVNLMQALMEFRRYRPSFELVCSDLRLLEPGESCMDLAAEDSEPPLPFGKSLEARGVSYTYPGSDSPALSDVSLAISHGESVAIVGPTGCGKSTLLKILIGLLPPEHGEVAVDGTPLSANILPRWHHAIGYVPQKPFLLNATLAENVTLEFDSSMVDAARIRGALSAAQLDSVVESLPEGVDTLLGEDAGRLSGGQRQRVALARALYRAPGVLVLDEATNALDQVTERAFAKALDGLRGRATVITVTHRLESIRGCDRVFFIVGGRVAASGTYGELMASSPEFKAFASEDASRAGHKTESANESGN